MTPLLKKIILIIILIAIGFALYTFFLKPEEDSGELISGRGPIGGSNSAQIQILGNQITQALIQIESLQLDKSIFQNPIFRNLEDRSRPIPTEPRGRRNPFAPLGDTSVNFDADQSAPIINTDQNTEPVNVQEDGRIQVPGADSGFDDPLLDGDSDDGLDVEF